MKNILILISLSMALFSCELTDALHSVNSMPGQMDGMNNNMTDMKDKMGELEMKRDLENPENYKAKSPVPYALLAPAKKFGEFATVSDLIGWFYTNRQIVEATSFRDNVPYGGEVTDADGNFLEFTSEAKAYEEMKVRTATLLSVVAGLAPNNKVVDLVSRTQNDEEYGDSVIEFLALRYNFITNVLLENKYTETVLRNIGEMEQAIQYLKNAEYIANLNFANSIRITTTSFEIFPENNANLSYALDARLMNKYWNKLNKAFEKNLKIGSYAVNENQRQSQQKRMMAAKYQIEQGLARSQQYVTAQP